MIHNCMIQSADRKRSSKGFTLLEMLIAVGVLVILLCISMIAVPSYVRGMTQLERDGIAKEIFVAAQNNLSMAYSQGYPGCTEFGTPETEILGEDVGEKGVYCYVVSADELENEESALSLMLPRGSVDSAVREGGNYVIRYHKDSGLVLDVFYAEDAGGKNMTHSFASDEYETLLGVRGDDHKDDRRTYAPDKSVIGYYGGVTAQFAPDLPPLDEPSVTVVNAERLYVIVTPGDLSDPLKLVITGKQSGAVKEFPLSSTGVTYPYDAVIGGYRIVLDDITAENGHFADIMAGAGFYPGENLAIKAVASLESDGMVIRTAESTTKITNSLFGDYKSGKVEIGNIRHLENLDAAVSSFSGSVGSTVVSSAVQLTDLSWPEFCGKINSSAPGSVTIDYDGGKTADGTFKPVDIAFTTLAYEGGDHIISEVTVNTAYNAGLFGDLAAKSVTGLKLVDFDIESTGASAGALAGSLSGTKVEGVVAYNDTKKNADDRAYEITGKTNAGGLIGYAEDAVIKSSAAALYVKSQGTSGGFIGKAKDSQIETSYAGGHTENARFKNNDTTGLARLNVQGTTTAGGFIGDASGVSVDTCYATCSSKGATAGGFIGKLSGTSSVMRSYTTGLVVKSTACGAFVGSVSGSAAFDGNRYVKNLSAEVEEDDTRAEGISGKDTARTDFILAEEDRGSVYCYDDALKTEYGGKFYFPNIDQLNNGGTSLYPGITDCHYGDWQVPNLNGLDYSFTNADTLRLEISLSRIKAENESNTKFTFTLTGSESGVIKYFIIDAADPAHPVIYEEGKFVSAIDIEDPDGTTPLPIKGEHRADGNDWVIITLDDITSAGHHFNEIFGGTFIPGEDLTVRLGTGESSWAELQEADTVTENSLFAKGSNGETANIKYARHLQNLDPVVSSVEDSYTKAKLLNDIEWDAAKYPTIYNANSSKSVSDTFYGLYNPKLTDFDGNDCTLKNFPIKAASSDMSSVGAGNAGLFRYVDKDLTVHNLRMTDCIIGDDTAAYAGTVIAQSNYCKVTLDTVLADSEAQVVRAGGTPGTAGGLIGLAGGATTLSINNSAASVLVSSGNGPAGGLVGEFNGTGTITKSYAGGHTVGGVFVTDNSYDYNIRSEGSAAGGLVGVATGPSLTITESFGAASVSAADPNMPAGGIIGGAYPDTPLELGYVYAIAPVRNVRITSGGASTPAGALVGNANKTVKDTEEVTSVYFLPELYVGADDDDALYGVAPIGYGTFEKNPGFAYYQKDAVANLIAAKTYQDTMQVRTIPYDGSLGSNRHDSTREYPFSIWTSFDFDETLTRTPGYTFGTYYGDWQPIDSLETVPHKVIFSYTNPLTGENVSIPESELGIQSINQEEENRVLTPYIIPIPGYKITGWDITYTDKNKVQHTVNKTTSTGYLTFSDAMCYDDITAVAVFEEIPVDPNYCTISFYYDPTDPTGANYAVDGISVFEQIGKTESYLKNTLLSTIEPPVRAIENCSFLGWYDSPTFNGTLYTFEDGASGSDITLTNDLKLYARYEEIEYYNITIDFMYVPQGADDSDANNYAHLQSVPRYRINDQPQYRIHCIKGTKFVQDIPLPTVTNFNSPLLTNYENATDEDLKNKFDQYILDDEKTLHIESFVEKSDEEDAASPDVNLIVVYHVVDMDALEENFVPYTIVYELADTASNGTYQEGATKTYNPYDGVDDDSVYFMAPVGTTIDVRPMTEGEIPGTSPKTDLFGYEVEEIEKLIITDDPAQNVVHVKYKRREFVITFNSLGGTYVYPQTCLYGIPLSTKKPNAADMKRQGYGFDTTKGDDGWTLLDLGVNFQDNTNIASKYHWSDTMPAANIVAWANWESKPVDYRVMFWYENSDSDNPYDSGSYSYMGSLSDKKYSGTEITSSDYKNYPGMSSSGHTTHTVSCYPGTGDAIGTKTTTTHTYSFSYQYRKNSSDWTLSTQTVNATLSDDGKTFTANGKTYNCIKNGSKLQIQNYQYETYQNRNDRNKTTVTATLDVTDKATDTTVYVSGGKEITIAGSSTKTGYVSTWSYKDGTPGGGKCIYVGGTWYFYTGTTNSGNTAPCQAPTYDWIDKNNFTFNDKFVETKTISSDGTTVLNVYFTRNTYTLMFYSNKKSTCMAEEHTHTDECYDYYCPGVHFHTDACLTCDKEEHTHTVDCCSLTEHTHNSTPGQCCSLEEHTHTSACCALEAHTHTSACCSLEVHTHTSDCCSIEEHTHSIANNCYTIATSYTDTKIYLKDKLTKQNASSYQNQLVTGSDGKMYLSKQSGKTWYWYLATLTCTKTEHTHNGTSCSYTKCGKTAHTHNGTSCVYTKCGKTAHTHNGTSCVYTACGKTAHKHGTGCNTKACPVGYEHTHGTGCNTDACTVGYEHTHSKAQGCYDGCEYPDHVHDENCIKYLVCKKAEHTHGSGCSKNLNGTRYLAGIIQAKYNEDIHEYFPIKNSDVDTWDDANGYAYDSSRKDALYSAYISAIDRMPAMPSGMTVGYFTNYAFSGSKTYYVYYYLETIPGDTYDRTTTLNGTTKYYKSYKTITFKGDGVSLTRDEEFHIIEGFERYAYQIGDKGTVKADSSSTTSYSAANNSDSSKPKAYFYYTRNSSDLEFYIGSEAEPPISVQYDAPLSSVNYVPTDGPDGYTFDGWYADPGLTNEIDFSKARMPLGNLAVYGRWAPPSYTVTFDADYIPTEKTSAPATYKASVKKKAEGTTVKYDPSDATNRSFLVESGANISDYITDAKGFILDSYTPEKSGYTFEGWFYDLDSTEDVIEKNPFISSIAITEPITIYADWKSIEDADTTRDITIYYIYESSPGHQIYVRDPLEIKDKYHVGDRVSFNADLDIYGYYPITMVQFLTVQSKTGGSANTLTFYYKPVKEWSYRTEYYAMYSNYEDTGELEGAFAGDTAFSDDTASYLICYTDGIPAFDQIVNVEFSFPEGYRDGYRFVQYDANGNTVKTTNTVAYLNKRDPTGEETPEELKMLNVVKFYIEPDPAKFRITDRITTYDGDQQALSVEDTTSANVFAFPNEAKDRTYDVDLPDGTKKTLTTHYCSSVSAGYPVGGGAKAFIANEYRYFDDEDKEISDASKLIHAGAYRMNGYVVLSITGIAEGETTSKTRTYLEWKNENYELNLRIQPRPVSITSTTASQSYNPLKPLVRSNLDGDESTWDIKVEGPNDGKPAFVKAQDKAEADGASYYFAVDAFRLDKGTSDNAFTYVLNDTTEPYDYHITAKFGTLTVN